MRRSWLLGTLVRRTGSQWRLLAAVLAVAVLSSSLVTTLGLLVTATEQSGIRGALSNIPAGQRSIELRVIRPSLDIADVRPAMDAAVADALAGSATTSASGLALSGFEDVPDLGEIPALAYLGDVDGITEHATLVDGEWATGGQDVAIPAAAADSLGLALGDSIEVARQPVTVVGTYEVDDPSESFWSRDWLHGAGNDPGFPRPDVGFYQATHAFGPLVVAPGGLDAFFAGVAFVDVEYLPTFNAVTVDGLEPLLQRLTDADTDVPAAIASGSESIFYSSDVTFAVQAVAGSLVVTRSTVVVVGLLLLVLAIAAMAQIARLFVDARASERQLMRARGAALRHVIALAIVEALIVGGVTAAASPPLASLVYRVLAAQPPMMRAGMPADAGLPAISWIIGGVVATLFVAVLVLPLLGRERSFVAGEQAKARPRLATGIMRSGVDVVLVVLAAVAVWQLQSYRSPVASGASLSIDPVLAAGPALVLVATALVCVRLIPAASRLVERVGEGSRGAVLALAAWEVGRRPQRATAAVLLLSLTLAVGTFGLAFLDTWRQSQVDQATVAAGAPARATADLEAPAAQVASLERGARGKAEPVIHRTAVVGVNGVQGSSTSADLLGLSAGARAMLGAGRIAEVGGSTLITRLPGKPSTVEGIVLPTGSVDLVVQIGDASRPVEGVVADMRAIVDNGAGVLSLVDIGKVQLNGTPYPLSAKIEGDQQLVGVQARLFSEGESKGADVTMLVGGLRSAPQDWSAVSSALVGVSPELVDAPGDWQLAMDIDVPQNVQDLAVSAVAWESAGPVPAVVTADFAEELFLGDGSTLAAQIGGASVTLTLVGTVPLVPGVASMSDLSASSSGLGSIGNDETTIVVDQGLLARALAVQGVSAPLVDEWWVDVAPGDGAAYAAAHEGVLSTEVIGTNLQEAPLRVGTQAALWLAIAAGALLAAVGFAAHSTATLRARRLELAQLRAIGFSRRRLVGLIGGESLLMAGLGAIFGVAIGLLLVFLVGPLVAVSPDGSPTIPSVIVQVPLVAILLLVAEMAVVLAAVVLLVAQVQRFAEPAELLREGGS